MAFYFLFIHKPSSNLGIFKAFGISESDYVLVSSDLGGRTNNVKLSYKGVVGQSDSIFKSRKANYYLAGEFKGRKYKGRVRLYEYYQATLYAGIVAKTYRSKCDPVIGYTNQTQVFKFDEKVFKALVNNRQSAEEAKYSKISFFNFMSKAPKPLHIRSGLSLPKNVY
jgi:hypothetical protein